MKRRKSSSSHTAYQEHTMAILPHVQETLNTTDDIDLLRNVLHAVITEMNRTREDIMFDSDIDAGGLLNNLEDIIDNKVKFPNE